MRCRKTRPRMAHDLTRLRLLLCAITMDAALGADGLRRTVRTARKALERIREEGAAFGTEPVGAPRRAVAVPAIHRRHDSDRLRLLAKDGIGLKSCHARIRLSHVHLS